MKKWLSTCLILLGSYLECTPIVVSVTTDSGAGSLREAIAAANASPETIVFDPSLAGQTITLTGAPLIITNTYTVEGGSNNITISGTGATRPFLIQSGTPTLSNLTLANGQALGGHGGNSASGGAGGGGGGLGGAVFSDSNITLTNVQFHSNNATGGAGGSNSGASALVGGGGGGGMGGAAGNSSFTNNILGGGGGGGELALQTGTSATSNTGGAGGGSGGAGGNSATAGTDGGRYGGGGGGGGVSASPHAFHGGAGGFGGGGGGEGDTNGGETGGQGGGAGGFGGGGGGVSQDSNGAAGLGGTGGGHGGSGASGLGNAGGGGAGFGGALFVSNQSTTTLLYDSSAAALSAFSGNTVAGGAAGTTTGSGGSPATAGSSSGTDIYVTTGGILNANISTDVALTIPSAIAGGGALTKNGNGTLLLTGANIYTGTTTLSAGTLKINGSVTSNTTVNGGTLSGIGTIIGALDIANGGTVSPGNSIGTLNVIGNYTQDSGSTYHVQINGAGDSSSINVTGTATINSGSALDIVSLDGGYNTSAPYTILTATNVAGTTYSDVTIDTVRYTPQLTYSPTEILLSLSRTFVNASANSNQFNVALQLDSITTPTAAQTVLLDNLTSLPEDRFQSALEEMSGEQYANLMLGSEQTNRHFFHTLYDPLRPALSSPCAIRGCNTDAWLEVRGTRSNYKADGHADSFRTRGFEVATGAQRVLGNNLLFGSALFFEADYYTYNGEGSGRQYTILGGLYGLYRPSSYYILTDIVFGGGLGKIDRDITVGSTQYHTSGRPNNYQAAVYVEVGKDFVCGPILFQPFVGVDNDYYNYQNITESGDAVVALNLPSHNYWAANSHLGMHIYTVPTQNGFSVALDADWAYRLTHLNDHRQAIFQEFGAIYDVEGLNLNRNSFEGALTVTKQVNSCWRAYVQVAIDVWGNAAEGSLLGGVMVSW